jgi:hypothetical protein
MYSELKFGAGLLKVGRKCESIWSEGARGNLDRKMTVKVKVKTYLSLRP